MNTLTITEQWRERADGLDRYASILRREGDTRAAEDAEQAATDYRIAADAREIEGLE